MKAKYVLTIVAVVALAAATVAYAQSEYSVDATASKKAGSTEKPKPFKGTWTYSVSGEGGTRAPAPDSWEWSWEGVKVNGKKFPTCTPEEIDAAQSDSVCPGKSLVLEAPIVAELGPENDPSSSVTCLGKSFRAYNGGKNKLTWIVVGPAEQCAVVAYLPPFEGTLKTKKTKVASAAKKKNKKAKTSTFILPLPENITHPLPGIAGGPNEVDATFIQRKKGKKKNKVAYMESTGCKGKREFKFTTVDTEGKHVDKTNAGRCK